MPFDRDHTIPLTAVQLRDLKLGAVIPFACLVPVMLGLGGFLTLLSLSRAGSHPFVKVLIGAAVLIMLAVIVATVFHVRNYSRDRASGVAQVKTRTLVQKTSTGRNTRTYYAVFEDIGNVILMYPEWDSLVIGSRYRVTYSERTRRGWSVEAVHTE